MEGTGKPNSWIEHVKAFAKKNNMTYGCALSDPKVKVGYVSKSKKVLNPLKKENPSKKKLVVVEPKKKLEMPEELSKLIQDFARPSKKPKPKAEAKKRNKRVIDIVKGKFDGKIYYYNRYHDKSEAYGIVDKNVMIIGKTIEDYNDVEIFDEPKPVASNVRFYNDDVPPKPIQFLNKLQEM